jgi:hypothetical protein
MDVKSLTLLDFLNSKLLQLEDNHGNLILKLQELEKEVSSLKEQILMTEGFLTYYARFRNEFTLKERENKSLKLVQSPSIETKEIMPPLESKSKKESKNEKKV